MKKLSFFHTPYFYVSNKPGEHACMDILRKLRRLVKTRKACFLQLR
jgi:hypothetical protein